MLIEIPRQFLLQQFCHIIAESLDLVLLMGVVPDGFLSGAEQERVQREKQREFKADNPELFQRYPKFSKALAKVLDPSDEIQPAATGEQIAGRESVLDFTLPAQVREFFLLTAGVNVSTGVILSLSGMFDLTILGERYCVLGEFWKEADGDQLLLCPGEETIWYYAHEQDKVKRLCNDMTELLEKKLARYLNEH